MKKALQGSLILIFFSLQGFARLLSWSPDFIQERITGSSDWKRVKFNQNFNIPNPALQTGVAQPFALQPGEYHIYLNTDVALPVTLISFNGKNTRNGIQQ